MFRNVWGSFFVGMLYLLTLFTLTYQPVRAETVTVISIRAAAPTPSPVEFWLDGPGFDVRYDSAYAVLALAYKAFAGYTKQIISGAGTSVILEILQYQIGSGIPYWLPVGSAS